MGSSTNGVSVDDLKRIAEESGIDPAFVDEALLTQAAKHAGRSTKGRYEALLEGELTVEQLGIVQESLSSLSGHKMLTQVGRTIQGTVSIPWGQLRVEVFSRNGRTKIQAVPVYSITFMMTGYAPAILGILGLVIGSVQGGAFLGLGLAVLFGTLSWLATIFGIGRANDSAKNIFDRLVNDISGELKSAKQSSTLARENLASSELSGQPQDQSVENRLG